MEVIESAVKQNVPLIKKEQEVLGTSHAEIGAYLLGLWGFPDPIVETVAFHHYPEKSYEQQFSPLTAVYVSNILEQELNASTGNIDILQGAASINMDYLRGLNLSNRVDQWRSLSRKAGYSDENVI